MQQHGQRLAERLVEIRLAAAGDVLDEPARELAHVLFHAGDRGGREAREQQPLVLGVLRRVGVHRQERPAVTDGRQHHSGAEEKRSTSRPTS